jgi:hypothetical protein
MESATSIVWPHHDLSSCLSITTQQSTIATLNLVFQLAIKASTIFSADRQHQKLFVVQKIEK